MDLHQCAAVPWLPCHLCNKAYFRNRGQLRTHLAHMCMRRRAHPSAKRAGTPPLPPPPPKRARDLRSEADDDRPRQTVAQSDKPNHSKLQLTETALSGYAKTYEITPSSDGGAPVTDVAEFLQTSVPHIAARLAEELLTSQGVKYTLWLEATYESPTGETTAEPRNFKTASVTVFRTSSLDEIINMLQTNIEKLQTEITEHEGRGSGWVLQSIDRLQLRLSKCFFYKAAPSGYVKLPVAISKKRACVNVLNLDDRCFMYAILSKLYCGPKCQIMPSDLDTIRHNYIFDGINFPTPITEIGKFEKLNPNTSVNVFALDGINNVSPLRVVAKEKDDHFDLLLITDKESNKHYVFIKDFEKLIRSQVTVDRHKITICKRCFTFKRNVRCRNAAMAAKDWLAEHKRYCNTFKPAEIVLPKEEDAQMYFRNISHHMKIPIAVYCDLESTLKPISACEKNPEISSTRQIQMHDVNSYAFLVKTDLPDELLKKWDIPTKVQLCREENAAFKLMSRLKQLAHSVGSLYKKNTPMTPLTPEEVDSYESSEKCKFCKKAFSDTVIKVRDHDHLTGRYRAAYCSVCNINLRLPTFIPVFFHNLMGYDSNFLIRVLALFKSRISIIPSTSEKFISFSVFVDGIELRFLDSLKFTLSSLDSLVKTLPPENFEETLKMVKDEDKFKLCLQKGVYFYDYIDDVNRFKETQLPAKEHFYNRLTDSHITEREYEHAQRVWNTFNFKTLGEYHDHYLRLDVTLLADVMQAFRTVCYREYNLDPFHSYTAPGLSWNAMLLKTGICLDLITDYDQYLFIESAMRGGLCFSNVRHAVANNESLENPADYDPSKPTSYIMYFDCTSQYGMAMKSSLPTGKFKWVDEPAKIDYKNIGPDSSVGYLIEFDAEYGEHLHDLHNDFPFFPKSQIPPGGKTKKLLATLENKTKYVAHHSILALAEKCGLKIVKIHRALQFEQSRWLEPYIDHNSKLRQAAKSEFEKSFFKLMINSIYGKSCENQKNRINLKLVTSEEEFLKESSKVNYLDRTIICEDLVAVHLNRHKIELNRPLYIGQCVLDIAKHIMYDFHYNVMCKHFNCIQLIYSDTDSLIYLITTTSLHETLKNIARYFDFSTYPKDHVLYHAHLPENTKKIGTFKDECGGRQIQEEVGLKAKMYAFRFNSKMQRVSEDVSMRAKGVKASAVRNQILFDHYKQALLENKTFYSTFNTIRSRNHVVYTEKVKKISITSFDDKRFITEDGIHTLAWGHYQLEKNEA